MRIRYLVLAIAALLGSTTAPAAAQSAVTGRASITVPELLEVRVAEAGELLRLDVVANRGWELEAVLEDGSGRSWSAGRVAEGRAGRERVALSYEKLLEESGAPAGSMVRFTLGAR